MRRAPRWLGQSEFADGDHAAGVPEARVDAVRAEAARGAPSGRSGMGGQASAAAGRGGGLAPGAWLAAARAVTARAAVRMGAADVCLDAARADRASAAQRRGAADLRRV